jgi:hypothetical protein
VCRSCAAGATCDAAGAAAAAHAAAHLQAQSAPAAIHAGLNRTSLLFITLYDIHYYSIYRHTKLYIIIAGLEHASLNRTNSLFSTSYK